MSNSYNKIILLGNLTKDPEVRVTTSNLSIAKLGLAINRRYKSNGAMKDEVTFVDIDVFGKQAEVLAKYATKGNAMMLEGRLRLETWQDKRSGQNRSKLGVVLENFQFVGGGKTFSEKTGKPTPVANDTFVEYAPY